MNARLSGNIYFSQGSVTQQILLGYLTAGEEGPMGHMPWAPLVKPKIPTTTLWMDIS